MTWNAGDRLIVRGEHWMVVRSTRFPDCEALDLSADRAAPVRTLLLPFDRPRRASARRLHVVSRRRWAHQVASGLNGSFPYGGLQFCPPAIRLLPYQLEPAIAVLRHGALRVLIGDEVGLGKTVEAGLIVREVVKADQLSRTLVLVPAGLRAQWAQELRSLFELDTIDADAPWLRRQTRELPASINPWSLPGIYISSIDFIKRPEALEPLERVAWDTLIVDEAHTATPRSDRLAAVQAIASRALRVVLLSATPHMGDDRQFAALCGIGAAPGEAPIVGFRRSGADTPAGGTPVRRTVLNIHPTPAEQIMNRMLEGYTAALWAAAKRRGTEQGALVAQVLCKRALSSARSLALSVARRLELLGESSPAPAQLALPWLTEDDGDRLPDSVLGAAGFDDPGEERPILASIHDAARAAAAAESKVRVLKRFFTRVREPAIVFSEYRDTAERLQRDLAADGHGVDLLHGGLPLEERRRVVASFTRGGRLLVATDAASEGLNLHHRCRLIVHFELPWTSSRLQQRCGRVNRIGQTRRVHEIALVSRDTAEHLVLVPLLRRALRSARYSGPVVIRQLAESRVGAHVLGSTPIDPREFSPEHLDRLVQTMGLGMAGREEAERLERMRRLIAGRRPRRGHDGMSIAVARQRRPWRSGHAPLTVIFSISLVDARGSLVERFPAIFQLEMDVPWARRASALRAQLDAILPAVRSRAAPEIDRLIERRLGAIRDGHAALVTATRRRSSAIRRPLRSTARDLVQAGLFDRRALRSAASRRMAEEMLQEETAYDAGEGGTEGAIRIESGFEVMAIFVGRLE